jgi:hypothetical protein
VLRVPLVLRVLQARRGRKERREVLALKVLREIRVAKALPDLKEIRVAKGPQEVKALQGQKEHKDPKERLVVE